MAAPHAPTPVVDDDREIVAVVHPSSPARRPARVMLAVAALVLGIGSCQLPQPRVPKLPVGAVGGVAAVASARAGTHTRDGST